MPRRKYLRRFDPQFLGVNATMIAEEAKTLAREVDNYRLLAATEVDGKRKERHMNCQYSWEHLQGRLERLPERERRIVHCLLFRDFYHVLELYLHFVKAEHPEADTAVAVPLIPQIPKENEFREFLFDLEPVKGERP